MADQPQNYFSFDEAETKLDTVDYRYHITTETETLKSDSTKPTILDEFAEAMVSHEWQEASLLVEHVRWTPKIRLRPLGAHLNELLEATFDNELGSCFVK